MVIVGIPKDISSYYMADDIEAFELSKAGFSEKYYDEGAHYFKLNGKLKAYLEQKGK